MGLKTTVLGLICLDMSVNLTQSIALFPSIPYPPVLTQMQASNSSSYVQDAFQLLCPVLQFTALQQSLSQEPPANVHIRS